jgi:hypothetical protein
VDKRHRRPRLMKRKSKSKIRKNNRKKIMRGATWMSLRAKVRSKLRMRRRERDRKKKK